MGWDTASMIATVGAGIAIESIVLLAFGARVKQMPVAFEGSFSIMGVPKANQGLFIIIAAVIKNMSICCIALASFDKGKNQSIKIYFGV